MDPANQRTSGVVDVGELGELLRQRRLASGLTLRELQERLGNSLTASSLSRIEHGALPDAKNVPVIARWLELSPDQIAWPGQSALREGAQSTPDAIEVHLRADKNLSPVAAEVLARTFRLLYDDIVSGRIPLAKGSEDKRE